MLSLAALVAGLVAAGDARAALLRGATLDAESGEAVAFVTVQVLGRDAGGADVALGVMSLSDGHYVFASVPLGRYLVRFTRIGYTTREDSLAVTEADHEYTLDVTLKVQPVPMKKIVVEEDRFAAARDVQTGFVSIKGDRLGSLPGIAEGDPLRTLQLVPGVEAASDFSSALYVRGGGPDQTLVLLDGTTVYNPTHAFGFFSTFNADATGDVNLYKGAYPAEYGGRLGAVLDVRTREARARRFAGTAATSVIASRASLEGALGAASWSVSGRRTNLEPLLDALRRSDNRIPSYYFYDTNGKISVPVAGGRAECSVYTGRDVLGFHPNRQSFLDLDWGNTLATGSFVRALGDRLLATARLSLSEYRSHTRATVFTTPASFENAVRDYSAGAEVKYDSGLHHAATVGIDVSKYRVKFSQILNQDTFVDYRRTPLEAAMFAQDRWRPWAETVIDAGVRTRYIDDGRQWLYEPRLSLAQGLSERLRAKLGGGIYHQYLQLVATEGVSAADFYVPLDGTADVGRSWQVVGGLDWRWRPSTTVSIEGYYTGLSHLVMLDNSTAANARVITADDLFYLNGTGHATGVELFIRRDVGAVTGWIGYTLGWTTRSFPEVNDGQSFPPKYDRRHDLSAVGEYTRGPWRFTGAFVYATGQAFTPVAARYALRDPTTGVLPASVELLYGDRNSARLLPYNRLDLGVARKFSAWGAKAEWQVEVFNVYSRRNEWFVQYNRDQSTVAVDVAHMLPIIPSVGVTVWF